VFYIEAAIPVDGPQLFEPDLSDRPIHKKAVYEPGVTIDTNPLHLTVTPGFCNIIWIFWRMVRVIRIHVVPYAVAQLGTITIARPLYRGLLATTVFFRHPRCHLVSNVHGPKSPRPLNTKRSFIFPSDSRCGILNHSTFKPNAMAAPLSTTAIPFSRSTTPKLPSNVHMHHPMPNFSQDSLTSRSQAVLYSGGQ